MATKIINVSNEPYEFTWDAGHYGPYAPGTVVELPDEVAAHAVRHSAMIDPDFGEDISYRMEYLSTVAQDKDWIKKIATYPCPFAATNQCNAQPFKKPEELKAHLESHWAKPSEAPAKAR